MSIQFLVFCIINHNSDIHFIITLIMIYNYHLLFKYIMVGDPSRPLFTQALEKVPFCSNFSIINSRRITSQHWAWNSPRRYSQSDRQLSRRWCGIQLVKRASDQLSVPIIKSRYTLKKFYRSITCIWPNEPRVIWKFAKLAVRNQSQREWAYKDSHCGK